MAPNSKIISVIGIGLFLATNVLASENLADKYFGSTSKRTKIFDSYVNQIRNAGIIDSEAMERRLGPKFEDELKIARRFFVSARTKEDVYYSLLALRNTLHDAHSRLFVERELEMNSKKAVELPFTAKVREVDGKFIFSVVASNIPSVSIDSRILSIDGTSTANLMEQNRIWLESNSPEFLALQTAEWLSSQKKPWKRPTKNPGEKSAFELQSPTGEKKSVLLEWKEASDPILNDDPCVANAERYSSEYKNAVPIFRGINFCAYQYPNNVLLVRYFSFDYDFEPGQLWNRIGMLSFEPRPFVGEKGFSRYLEKEDQSQLKDLILSREPGLIVLDIRENGGGNISPELISIFARNIFQIVKRQVVFTKKMRDDEEFFNHAISMADLEMVPLIKEDMKLKKSQKSRLFPFFCKTKQCLEDEANYEPDLSVPKPNVVLLTGPFCMSSCDQFSAILQDNKIAKIAGLSPRGGHSPFRADLKLKLHNASSFKITVTTGLGYRPNGISLDGNPATPDFQIWPDGSDIKETISKITSAFK